MSSLISQRKDDHLSCVLSGKGIVSKARSGFASYRFEHNALPEISFSEIDTSVKFLGRTIDFPLIISSVTGGSPKSQKINIGLAETANDFNIGFAVGSQRIALEDKAYEKSFKIRNYVNTPVLKLKLRLNSYTVFMKSKRAFSWWAQWSNPILLVA